MFQSIMGYMSDSSLAHADELAAEVIAAARNEPSLRNELYLGIMRQLTRNPDYDSVQLGHKLLAMMVNDVPISEELFNHLALFARQHVPTVYSAMFAENSPAALLALSEHDYQ